MRPALDPAGHRVPRTKPTCLLHTWRPHRQRPFALVLHLHQHESSGNLHLQYLAKNQSTQCCQSLITRGSDHPPVLEPHMVLTTSSPALWEPKTTGHRHARRCAASGLPSSERSSRRTDGDQTRSSRTATLEAAPGQAQDSPRHPLEARFVRATVNSTTLCTMLPYVALRAMRCDCQPPPLGL
jgi:hypothetical protein